MASDSFGFDNSFDSDPFFPFTDATSIDSSYHDFNLQSFQDCDNLNSLDLIACGILSSSSSSSPPTHYLENLSLTQMINRQNFLNASTNSLDSSVLEIMKSEELRISEKGMYLSNSLCMNSVEDQMNLIQRSYNSPFYNGKQLSFSFPSIFKFPNSQPQGLCSSPESKFDSYQIRKISSTGDLHRMKNNETRNIISTSSLSGDGSFLEESNFKVERYTAEEKKERINRYKAKRNQRNFNKTIKYACRKTLADSRQRIRGRFARNDDAEEIPKSQVFNGYVEEDEFWVDPMSCHKEEDGTAERGIFCNHQYYSF